MRSFTCSPPRHWFFAKLSSPPQYTISPSRNSAFFRSIIIFRKEIIFISRWKIDGSFLKILKNVAIGIFNFELIRTQKCFPIGVFDTSLHIFSAHIDAIIEVTAPENIVMSQHCPSHGKHDVFNGFIKVIISVRDVFLSGRKMGTEETKGRGMVTKSDGHSSLIACCSTHTRFHIVHGHILDVRCQFRLDKNVQTDSNQLVISDKNEFFISIEDFAKF